MPRSYDSLTLDVAVVDAVGHLIAFIRQDGALMGSIDLAINKAVTARMFDGPASQAQSGKPSFGIQESDAGKLVIFDAGIPSPLAATSLAPLRRAPRRLSRTFQLRTQP